MTYLDAAYHILQQAAHPLHYRAIAERALAAGLIHPTGLTPEATMGSRLYTQTQEEPLPFARTDEGQGFFALAEWQPAGIDHQVQRINHEIRTDLRRLLHTMPADRFDALIGELLIKEEANHTADSFTSKNSPQLLSQGLFLTSIYYLPLTQTRASRAYIERTATAFDFLNSSKLAPDNGTDFYPISRVPYAACSGDM